MRILHTADWHLGHTLHGHRRGFEHRRFLAWLTGVLEGERIDALIIAGDVFDVANPPADAQAVYYEFLVEARRRCPELEVIVVAGNHDSAARLCAPRPLLDTFGVHVVGRLPRRPDGHIDTDAVVVPLRDASGRVAVLAAAVPFLREADLRIRDSAADGLIEGVRDVYTEVLDAARRRRAPDQAIVAIGHCYMGGTEVSELSERRVLGGNLHALPADLFPDDVAYTALGHLHKAQPVAGRDNLRYSGSPIPLSLAEAGYPHQVRVVELRGAHCDRVRALRVPRAVELLRLPHEGPAPLDAVLAEIETLPADDGSRLPERWPFVELRVLLDSPEPELRPKIEAALEGRAVRLIRIAPTYPGDRRGLAERTPQLELVDLDPVNVFEKLYADLHDGEPAPEILHAFGELVDEVGRGGA